MKWKEYATVYQRSQKWQICYNGWSGASSLTILNDTGGEGEANSTTGEKESAEESNAAKNDEEGNDDGASNGDIGESKSSDSQIANGDSAIESAGVINREAISKLHAAMKVYKSQHKALIQDCLVAAGFDQRKRTLGSTAILKIL